MPSIVVLIQNAIASLAVEYSEEHQLYPIFVSTEHAPSTGKEIFAAYQAAINGNKQLPILADDTDTSVYGREHNQLYRFIHDIDHAVAYQQGKGTTRLEHEVALNLAFSVNVFKKVLHDTSELDSALMAFFICYYDTVGQAVEYSKTGNFVVNQKQFVYDKLQSCKAWQALKHGQNILAKQCFDAILINAKEL